MQSNNSEEHRTTFLLHISATMKEEVRRIVKEDGYTSMSSFIREAVNSRITDLQIAKNKANGSNVENQRLLLKKIHTLSKQNGK